MPVVLSQHAWSKRYLDVEGALYHYPRVYFSRVLAYDRFIYYRPLGESTRRSDSLCYFGHGVLGAPFNDLDRTDHRYVDVVKYEPFPNLVPLQNAHGDYFETESPVRPQAQSAVRAISEISYYKILAAAGVRAVSISQLPSTELVSAGFDPSRMPEYPKDPLREIRSVPKGTGYVPRGTHAVDVYESAALQERARADHQLVLSEVLARVHELGGTTWFNNNIDLFARVRGCELLFEAKSLTDPRQVVDRMRYGIGQLFDYRVRYSEEVGGALPVLALGRPMSSTETWIGSILDGNGVALIATSSDGLVALNRHAKDSPIFG